jgi:hypothetical protein
MSSPSADHDRDTSFAPHPVASTDPSAQAGGGAGLLWLLVAANGLFFAFAAALLASG